MQLPARVQNTHDLAQVRDAARRLQTPCGDDGSVVWHCWGEGAPLVLLHGGSGSWTHWARNIAPLCAAGYWVIAPDLPGFGDSSLPPDGRDGDVMPGWLALGLQSIVGSETCAIAGFSFGAMVGTLMAAQYSERINQLVLVGAPALSDISMPHMGLRNWEQIPAGAQRDVIHRHNLSTLMFANPEKIDVLAIRLHEANLQRDRLRSRRLQRTDIVVRTMPDVQCPVTGIWGERDSVYLDRLHTIAPALEQAPNYKGLTLLPGVGHWAPYEAADIFNPRLLDALNAV